MKRWLHLVSCVLLSAAALAQTPVSVVYQKTLQVAMPGATAAYSLDSSIAEASAQNGIVEIQGRGPGATSVIVVTSAGAQTLSVTVAQPPPSYPPGFVPPSESNASEQGSYEVRYNSNPAQLTNTLTLMRTQGDSFDRMSLVNSTLFSSGTQGSQFGFPQASYELKRPGYDVTFVDQTVYNSPLTVDGYAVRGLHLQMGDWIFHGGYTSIATFQDLFLSTNPEYVAGLGRRFKLHHQAGTLEGNLFYFQNTGRERLIVSSGAVGSLVYRLKLADRLSFVSEAGISHAGLAFAANGTLEGKKGRLNGNFRILPQRFASLAVNNQHGTFANVNATRDLNRRFLLNFNLSQSDFNLPTLKQNNLVTDANLSYKLSTHFTLGSGVSWSHFRAVLPAGASLSTLNIPVSVDFSSRHFGTGFQYQRSVNFDSTGGNDYAVNVRGSVRRLMMNAAWRHDVQVPTLSTIIAQVPGLQDFLDRAGIVVTTPDQLAQLLQNSVLLSTLGFTAPFSVGLATARDDINATVSFTGNRPSHPQISASYFDSSIKQLGGSFRFETGSLSYSQHIGNLTEIVASASLLHSTSGSISAGLHPVYALSLRRRLNSAPSFLLPGRHGEISGHVFRDDQGIAQYRAQQAGLGGVEIRLDNTRVTRTDSRGYYSFRHVPFGTHRVEAKFESPEPFFYTTDSPAVTDMEGIVDFGVSFTKDQVFGFITNDAGQGIAGVTVELKNPGVSLTTQTNADGKFSFLGLDPGDYQIVTQAASYPPGYSLQDLQDHSITVEAGKPSSLNLRVKALRAFSGRVTGYDRTLLQNVPLAGVTVRVKELSLEMQTGANGAYIFRNLPSGTFTVIATYQGREVSRAVIIPGGPANVREVDLSVGAK